MFLRVLQDRRRLQRCYTQNIDGLEAVAGLTSNKTVQCHGTLSTLSCQSCGKRVQARERLEQVLLGEPVMCGR